MIILPMTADQKAKPDSVVNLLKGSVLRETLQSGKRWRLMAAYPAARQNSRGQFALQAEGSEVDFRQVELTPISKLTE